MKLKGKKANSEGGNENHWDLVTNEHVTVGINFYKTVKA